MGLELCTKNCSRSPCARATARFQNRSNKNTKFLNPFRDGIRSHISPLYATGLKRNNAENSSCSTCDWCTYFSQATSVHRTKHSRKPSPGMIFSSNAVCRRKSHFEDDKMHSMLRQIASHSQAIRSNLRLPVTHQSSPVVCIRLTGFQAVRISDLNP